MSETKYGEPHQGDCGNCRVLGQRILDLRSSLEAAEAELTRVREQSIREVLQFLDERLDAEELDMAAERFQVDVEWRE